MTTTELIASLSKVFIMILPGYLLIKLNLIEKEYTKNVSAVITYITFPCMVIDAMQMEYSREILINCKYVVLITAGVIIAAILVSKVLTMVLKLPASQSGIMSFMMVFGNTGFLGLPILDSLFGKEGVFYGALCDSVMGLFMFTIGVVLIRQASKNKERLTPTDILTFIKDPCFLCVFIGTGLYLFRITLPDIIGEPVASIGSTTGPLAMMVVGSHLAQVNLISVFQNKLAYLSTCLKLLLAPAIALLLVLLLIGNNTMFGTAIIMQTAMPCAMITVILGEKHQADTELATKGVILSTVLCLITIPVIAIILQSL